VLTITKASNELRALSFERIGIPLA